MKMKAPEVLYTPNMIVEIIEACRELCAAVRVTGGLVRFRNGMHAPAADPDWIDLGEAVLRIAEAVTEPMPVEKLPD